MRTNLGFGVVLAVASLTAAGTAYGQAGAAGTGGQGTPVGVGRTNTVSPSSLLTAPNNLEQQSNQAAANTPPAATPAVPGQVSPAPAAGNQSGNPLAGYPATGNTNSGISPAGGLNPNQGNMTPGTVNNNAGFAPGAVNNNRVYAPGTVDNNAGNAAATVNGGAGYPQRLANSSTGYPQVVNPGAGYSPARVYSSTPYNGSAYSSNYYAPGAQEGAYPSSRITDATPGYTNRIMPGMAGYNSVNPMGTTMAPGYYYAGTAGMPYATGATTGVSSNYVSPNYYNQGYVAQPPTGVYVQPRRGLFGRRRNRVVYTSSPYGTTYGNTGYGYNNGTTYSGYNTTGYNTVTTPGTYNYTTAPY